ncbi:tRNA uridine-5-carboxymethylaminomethyl(34) synthesis GTPase MnmE [Devosia sp. MC521]|uniref:tRNA uridine-5-carboxymethylaminomethyl(34) synthesis GTPase MnmE n=1 Tax=Devosia sp. MC521 TaxID=2759954 RepID=UPI0015FDCC02|nr:tRNA uridine-5-carboxymethylaminomethyl(34) synthesis GTPase MnmE [Devosia sp. MC521]MBJ6988581.1 tRNA uridine-5-carboxymethylaminomethyl(34) synthesis GTPase MnmE [Devosia sp. MC521]QMW62616.1 tRNA uridine-5-carboxymethylaminomethyl(34) synthesis GTPase MnmE [Devosia sp. MC521]
MQAGDTIMALSSGSLPAGVAVIRLSGPLVQQALQTLASGVPAARKMALRSIGADRALDQGLVVFFPTPNSFTGEDCAELHVHGSPAGVKAILAELATLGLRLAEAGEFTRRAFENGKLDLIEVEGLGDLLSAETEKQRQQALARYDGRLTEEIDQWRDTLLDLRAEIEARLDFSDEGDVSDDLPSNWLDQLTFLESAIGRALDSVESGRIVREGLRVALAGAPNAGKSSLINALSRSDVAIVSDEAGTTRDVREVPLDIGGQKFVLLDLAGLRETDSKAEAEGVKRAHKAIADADIVLWLRAPDVEDIDVPETSGHLLTLGTKSDIAAVDADFAISTETGAGLPQLFAHLAKLGEAVTGVEPSLVSHERDRQSLQAALATLQETRGSLHDWELAAESLRNTSAALERMIGRLDAERVLDRLFSSFCIGK